MADGTVVAGVCFVAILLLSCYVYADSVNRISTISWRNIEVASSIDLEKLETGLTIANVIVAANGTKLYLNATNTGSVKIDRADFPKIDVILTYTDNKTNLRQTYWCYYNSANSSRHSWSLNSSFTNPYPSTVNPLDWNPSETLSLVIVLASINQFKPDTFGYVKVILPQGSSNGSSFFTGTA